ncbi:MAG: class I SAM-dependent methyltransferase [Betaproteobacteria bacterium]|nr:class I SAM-dependent methyltransferase [Betaproteobacteria bacterium]
MQNYEAKSSAYFAHARKEIAPLLPPRCGRVLEVGCGSGATLAWLRASGRAEYSVGVEISSAAAESARSLVDEIYCLDFEKSGSSFAQPKFDVILCLDVLEHMVDPWRVVDQLVTDQLAPGGTLVMSLPNVRHYSVVLPLLLQGRWDYETAGLLDRTHLRFFTRRTALAMVSHPLLKGPRCLSAGFDWPSLKASVNFVTAGLFRDLLTYQYLLSAHKPA